MSRKGKPRPLRAISAPQHCRCQVRPGVHRNDINIYSPANPSKSQNLDEATTEVRGATIPTKKKRGRGWPCWRNVAVFGPYVFVKANSGFHPFKLANIREGLLFSVRAPGRRLSRLAPVSVLAYLPSMKQQNRILLLVQVSWTVRSHRSCVCHSPEHVFKDANGFVAECWLGGDAKEVERCWVLFSKGSRSCSGFRWVAVCLFLAYLPTHFNLNLWKEGRKEGSDGTFGCRLKC
jgi:hypothetical protein